MLSSWVDVLVGATSPEHGLHFVSLSLATISGDRDAALSAVRALSRLSPPDALPPSFLASLALELHAAFGARFFSDLSVPLVSSLFAALPPLDLSQEASEVASALARDGFSGSCADLTELADLLA